MREFHKENHPANTQTLRLVTDTLYRYITMDVQGENKRDERRALLFTAVCTFRPTQEFYQTPKHQLSHKTFGIR